MGNDPWIDWTSLEKRMETMLDAIIRGMTADKTKAEAAMNFWR
jgi:hypothetical protein